METRASCEIEQHRSSPDSRAQRNARPALFSGHCLAQSCHASMPPSPMWRGHPPLLGAAAVEKRTPSIDETGCALRAGKFGMAGHPKTRQAVLYVCSQQKKDSFQKKEGKTSTSCFQETYFWRLGKEGGRLKSSLSNRTKKKNFPPSSRLHVVPGVFCEIRCWFCLRMDDATGSQMVHLLGVAFAFPPPPFLSRLSFLCCGCG